MAHHLRRTHHVATLDLAEVGLRTARRSTASLRWHAGEDDPLGASFRCARCRDQVGEGWDRYYTATYWPEPSPRHVEEIHRHFDAQHPRTRFEPDRINTAWRAIPDWQASFWPLTPQAPAGFLCALCRHRDDAIGVALAPRIALGTPPYGDARRLVWLRATRRDLQADLAGRSAPEQAALLDARDRQLVLRDLAPATVESALSRARRAAATQHAHLSRLEAAVVAILVDARAQGEQPTRFIAELAALAEKPVPTRFTTMLGRATPQLAAREPAMRPAEFRRAVRSYLGDPDRHPRIGERRIWRLWIQHARDAP